jgi:hypothetical protein
MDEVRNKESLRTMKMCIIAALAAVSRLVASGSNGSGSLTKLGVEYVLL